MSKKRQPAQLPTTPPRHADIGMRTGAEHAVYIAIKKVTALGNDPRIAEAVEHLNAALALAADVTDNPS
jgi:hypothetical protein